MQWQGFMKNFEEFYTVMQLSEILSVHPVTIKRAIKNGHIQAFRTGIGKKSHYRIPKTEISRLAEFSMADIIKNLIVEKD